MNFAIELGKHFASEIVVLNVDIPYDLSRIKPAVKDKDGNEIESARLTPLELAQREAGNQAMTRSPSRNMSISIRRKNLRSGRDH